MSEPFTIGKSKCNVAENRNVVKRKTKRREITHSNRDFWTKKEHRKLINPVLYKYIFFQKIFSPNRKTHRK